MKKGSLKSVDFDASQITRFFIDWNRVEFVELVEFAPH